MGKIRLTIASDLAEVFLISLALNKYCEYLGMDVTEAYEVELCITEAVTNVIRHAYLLEGGHVLSVNVSIDAEWIEMEVIDSGLGMPDDKLQDLHGYDEPHQIDPVISTLAESGRGLSLIRGTMDSVTYFREGSVNHLIMVRHLRQELSADGVD